MSWQQTVDAVRERLSPLGLTLCQPFRVGWYNKAVQELYRLPGEDRFLGVLVASAGQLWPRFVDALRAGTADPEAPNPLDEYLVEVVHEATSFMDGLVATCFSHEPPPRRVAMQTLAEVSGMALRGDCQLSVHPVYGPWFSLRVVFVFDRDGPTERVQVTRPCGPCERHCAPAFATAMAQGSTEGESSWRHWLAVREACSHGQQHRYPDEQVEYHYTKRRDILRALAKG